MGRHATGNGPSTYKETEFHVERERIRREVGAGDQQHGVVGHGALDVQRAVMAGCIHRTPIEGPDVLRVCRAVLITSRRA
jgi:hypothetical protein